MNLPRQNTKTVAEMGLHVSYALFFAPNVKGNTIVSGRTVEQIACIDSPRIGGTVQKQTSAPDRENRTADSESGGRQLKSEQVWKHDI